MRSSLVLLVLCLSIISCENNIEVIKNLGNSEDIPAVSMKDIEIMYSDSAKIKMKVSAPELKRFDQPDKQYSEFPKGILVHQYDSAQNIVATIQANSAVYYEKTKLWVARVNVIVKNLSKNEELTSEELFWDQNKGIIYSTKSTTIINADGVFFGEGGFEAKQDMSKWKMAGIKGKVNLKESDDSIQNP